MSSGEQQARASMSSGEQQAERSIPLAAPREEVEVAAAEPLVDVAQDEVEEDGDEGRVRVHLVVVALLERKVVGVPVVAEAEGRTEDRELGGGAEKAGSEHDSVWRPRGGAAADAGRLRLEMWAVKNEV